MPDVPNGPPSDDERRNRRRDSRTLWLSVLSVILGISPALTSSIGSPALTNVWTILFVIVAAVLIAGGFWLHENERRVSDVINRGGGSKTDRPKLPLPKSRRLLQRAAIAAVIFGAGAWIGSSAHNTYLLAVYGSLGDLAIGPGRTSDPAVIALRKDNFGDICFYTTATFNVRNATTSDVKIGVISNSLTLSDNADSTIFVHRYPDDITTTFAGVSGAQLVKGAEGTWEKGFDTVKDHLTTLRRGESKDITIFQQRDNTGAPETCTPDPDGKVAQNYSGSAVRIAGELAMVWPDGTWRRESFDVDEPAKIVK